MPAEVLDVTTKFMREPVRILVKKEELTLEGIKQFYINVEREVITHAHTQYLNPFFIQSAMLKSAGLNFLQFSPAGHASMVHLKEGKAKAAASEMGPGGTSFLMSRVLCLKILRYTSTFTRFEFIGAK